MKIRGAFFLGILLALLARPVGACSFDYYTPSFVFEDNGIRFLAMPEADFLTELCTHFAVDKRVDTDDDARGRKHRSTVRAQMSDLAEIITKSRLSPASIEAVT